MTDPPRDHVTFEIVDAGGVLRLERRRYTLAEVGAGRAANRISVAADALTIGSAATCGFVVTAPGVSRHHARLEVRPDGIWIRDLGSTNGTRVDGLRIGEARLPERASLRLGEHELAFALTDEREPLALSARTSFGGLLGGSVAMRRMYALLERVAASEAAVLIEGESGTGKELVAEALHRASPRAAGPFVVIDCAALPAGLIEAELFGHVRGAFTGAGDARDGAIVEASGGTVFLDEIGELELALQPKLLRLLERREVRPVGATFHRPVDVRIVAATNRDLEAMVTRNEFRLDLFHRLAVLRVRVPPLRERLEDLPVLARAFADELAAGRGGRPELALTPDVVQALRGRGWTGNVRELRNAVERALIVDAGRFAPTDAGEPELDARALGGAWLERPYGEARERWTAAFERAYVERALARARGNVARAAREAGVDRAYLFRLIKRHRIRIERGGADDAPP